MGLLDWLTEGIGSDTGGMSAPITPPQPPMGGPPPASIGSPSATPPMAPQMPPGLDAAPTAPLTDPTAGPPPAPPTPEASPSAIPPPPPLPPDNSSGAGSQPVPMPQPRPAAANAAPPAPPPAMAPPVPAGGGAGVPMPPVPGPPTSLAPPQMPVPSAANQPPPGATGFVGRALGLDANRERSLKGALGAGLTAAGNSAGKSPFQALASGAGASLEGGQKAEDTGYDQRIKALQLAVNAKTAGNKDEYNKQYATYLMGKLQNDKDAATPGGKKGASWNKPDSQKFMDAQIALARDPEIRASQKMLEGLQKSSDPNDPNLQKAVASHNALIAQKQKMYLTGVGLNPDQLAKNMANPPGTPQNPHIVTSKEDFDTYVKPGQAYKNPADGKIYIRKDAAATPAGGGAAPSAPEPPGPAPGTVEDDKED